MKKPFIWIIMIMSLAAGICGGIFWYQKIGFSTSTPVVDYTSYLSPVHEVSGSLGVIDTLTQDTDFSLHSGNYFVGNDDLDLSRVSSGLTLPVVLESSPKPLSITKSAPVAVVLDQGLHFETSQGTEYTGTLSHPETLDMQTLDTELIPVSQRQHLLKAIHVGAEDTPIQLKDSQGNLDYATVVVPLDGVQLGDVIRVHYSQDMIYRHYLTDVVVTGQSDRTYVTFQTPHFTTFLLGQYTGTFSINDDAAVTTSTSVVLYNTISGATHMRFGTSVELRDAAAWISYAATGSLTLNGSDGVKRVYAQYSGDGMITNVADFIVLDTFAQTLLTNLTGYLDGSANATYFLNPFNGVNFTKLSSPTTGSWSGETYMTFNGVNQYAEATRNIASYPFTLSARVKPSRIGGVQMIIDIGRSSSTSYERGIGLNNNKAFLRSKYGGTTYSVNGTTVLIPNRWYHVVGVFSSNTNKTLYVNGKLEGTLTTSSSFSSSTYNRFRVGSRMLSSAGEYFAGSIDEVRIYKAALSAGVISGLYLRTPDIDPLITFAHTPSLQGFSPDKMYSMDLTINGTTATAFTGIDKIWKTTPIYSLPLGAYVVTGVYTNVYGHTGMIVLTTGFYLKDSPNITYTSVSGDTAMLATLTGLDSTWQITNNFGSNLYLFTGAGEFMYAYVDKFGNTGSLLATNYTPGFSAVLTSSVASYFSGSTFVVTGTFGEATSNFVTGDVTVTNGAVTLFTSVSSTVYRMTITPNGQGIVTVKVNTGVATDSLGSGNTVSNTISTIYDTVGPTGTISINTGATATSGTTVYVALSATDTNNVTQMQLSCNGSTRSTAETYATSKSRSLTTGAGCSAGDGTKTVYVKYQDAVGNRSTVYSDTILLDMTLPIIVFTGVTPADNFSTDETTFTGQVEITDDNIWDFDRSRNGTSYHLYDSGLLAMYNFDNISSLGESASTVKDASIYANNGTVDGAAIWSENGKFGGAYNFDGVNDRISIGTGVSPPTITISTRVYRTGSAVNQGIIRKQSAYALSLYNNYIQIAPGNNFQFYNTNQTISLNTWTHIVRTYDGTTMKLYKDGVFARQLTLVGTLPSNTYPANIGYDDNSRWWNGKIDEMLIYNRALSSGEVIQLYKSNLAKIATNKLLYTNVYTGLTNGTYRYTGYTEDLVNLTTTTGRTINISTADTTPPTGGSFTINNDAQYTSGTAVTLNITCATDTGVGGVQVAFGNTASPTNRQTCSATSGWTLTAGDGTKTVYMRWKDSLGNTTSDTTDTILLDTTAPIIVFTGVTPADNLWINSAIFTGQLEITDNNLGDFDRSRNGTSYNLYDSGLVLMYNFDNVSSLGENSSTVKDLSQYNNTGTINGATRTSNGKFGGSYSFDGNDYIDLGNNSVLSTNNITVSVWVNPSSTSGLQTIISKAQGAGYGLELGVSAPNQWSRAPNIGGSYYAITGDINATTGRTHLVGTYDGSTVKFYINGILQSKTISVVGNIKTSAVNLFIGQNPPADGNYFLGQIDEMLIYNRALSSGEINQLYKSNLNKFATDKRLYTTIYTGLTSGIYRYTGYAVDSANLTTTTGRTINIDTTAPIIVFTGVTPADNFSTEETTFTGQLEITDDNIWDFDRSRNGTTYNLYESGLVLMYNLDNVSSLGENASTVKDASQYANNGTVSGPTWTGDGMFGGAYSFDGVNDYVNIPTPNGLQIQTNLTLSARINPQTPYVGDIIILGKGAYYLTLNSSMGVSVYRYGKTPAGYHSTANGLVTTGQRNHIVSTRDSDSVDIYVNGVLSATVSSTGLGNDSNTQVRLGSENTGTTRQFHGSIDEVRIYKRTLSSGEINQLYKSNLNKFATDKRLYTNIYTGLTSGTYRYTGYALDLVNLTTTGRTINIGTTDTTPPTGGSFKINNDAQYTSGTAVTLNITCATDTGVGGEQVAFGNTASPTNRQTCGATSGWTLTAGDGTKTVYMRWKDSLGNTTSDTTDTILLDTTVPIIVFTGVTPADNFSTNGTTFTGQLEIVDSNLGDFDWLRNGTTYNLYDSGLIAMYNFDNVALLGENASTVKDVSQYANNGTISGATRNSNGKYGGAYNFDGNNNSIALNPITTQLSGSFTFSTWAYPTINTGGVKTLMASEVANFSNYWISLATYQNKWQFGLYEGTHNPYLLSPNNYDLNTWTHVVGVRDIVAQKIYLYINGILVSSGTDTTTSIPTYSAFNIGAQATQADRYFSGQIDEVLVYNRALSSGEILQLYRSNLAKLDTDYWMYTNIYTGLTSGTYRYTGYTEDLANLTTTTGRTINIGTTDTTPPTGGSFKINNDAQYTSGTAVTLNITCATDTGVGGVQVAFGNTANPTNRQTCSATSGWTLIAGDGTKTVYMRWKDSLGNITSDTTDTILLDTTAPIIVFTGVTPADNFSTEETTFTGQLEIVDSNLGDFDWLRNGTTYNLYDSGLIAMYNFDNISSLGENASTVKDVSQYANNGTISGATWGTNGKYNGAYIFDGINDFIQVGTINSTPNTFCSFVKVSTSMADATRVGNIFGNYPNSNNINIEIHQYGRPRIYRNAGQVDRIVTSVDLRTNNWEHICFVRNSTNNKIYFYLNGVLNTSNSDIGSDVGSVINPRIGNDNRGGAGLPFSGQIDEVRIYNRALSSGEITQLYKSNLSKFATDKRLYTNIYTGLTSGTYRYTGYALDLANLTTTTGRTINIDTTAPTLSFTDDVAAGPVTSDTITASWGDATIAKWTYSETSSCPAAVSGNYTYFSGTSMNQTTEANNTKYICLLGIDSVGNATTLASANDINISTTAPSVSLTSNVGDYFSGSTFVVTGTFSEVVYNFVTGDVTVTNGTVTLFTAVSSTVYRMVITPSGQGSVSVKVDAGVATNAADNGNTASNTISTTYDTVGPTGTISINTGATATSGTTVYVALSATDTNNVTQMQLSCNGSTRSTAETYATSKSRSLTTGAGCSVGDGTKTVYVKYQDTVGNRGSSYNDTITLDTTAPTFTFVDVTVDEGSSLTMSVSNVIDSGVGLASLPYNFSYNGVSWSGWQADDSVSLGSQPDPTTQSIWVKIRDDLGNQSAAVLRTGNWTNVSPLANDLLMNAELGSVVTFVASGSDEGGGSLTYAWYTGSICAGSILDTNSSFQRTLTDFGPNMFSYKVFDAQGSGSSCAIATGMAVPASDEIVLTETSSPALISQLASGGYESSQRTVNDVLTTYYVGTTKLHFINSGKLLAPVIMQSVSAAYPIEVQFNSGTIIKQRSGSYIDYDGVLDIPKSKSTNIGLDNVVYVTSLGITGEHLYFRNQLSEPIPVTVRIPAPGNNSGDIVNVYYSIDDTTWFLHTLGASVALFDGLPYAEFTTTHFTDFAIQSTTGSFVINNDIAYINTGNVTLNISLSVNISGMRFSNDGTNWSTRESYTTSKAWTLTGSDGTKTVYAQFDNNGDNISDVQTQDTIVLDRILPLFTGVATGVTYTGNVIISFSDTNISGALLSGIDNSYYNTISNGVTIGVNGTYMLFVYDAANNITGATFTINKSITNSYGIYVSGNGTDELTFVYTIADGDNAADLDYLSVTGLFLDGGTIKDIAGNDAVVTLFTPGAQYSLGYNKNIVIDTLEPTVTLTSNVGSDFSGSNFVVTGTFSEVTNNFVTGDVTVTNGTVTLFTQVSGTVYRMIITPSGQGSVTVKVNAGVATDTAGNENTASNTISTTYDSLAPTLVFIDDVLAGPVTNNTITASWGDATIAKWTYSATSSCPAAVSGNYSYFSSTSMSQTTEANNTKYICLLGIDSVGNATTKASANDINIDITGPTFTFANANGYECVTGYLFISSANDTGIGLHANPYSFNGTNWNTTTGILISPQQPGQQLRTGYVRDGLLNQTMKTGIYTFNNVLPTITPTTGTYTTPANPITGTRTLGDVRTYLSATEGACGVTDLTATLVGSCTLATSSSITSNSLTIIPNANTSGTGVCTIKFTDNENSVVTGYIQYYIDTEYPTSAPTCTPAGYVFSGSTSTISCSAGVGGTVVRYTTNGSAPTVSSPTWSNQSFSATTTLKSISCDSFNNCNTSLVEQQTYTLDNTAPTLSFTDNVEVGPLTGDIITATWGDAVIAKWTYSATSSCPTAVSGNYTYFSGSSMNQTNQTYNTKYICLLGIDSVGNATTKVSANDINIDITGPTFTFANANGNECVAGSLTITSASDGTGIGLHVTPYSFNGTNWTGNATIDIASQQPGQQLRTGYVRDGLLNQTIKTGTYTFNNVSPTANSFAYGSNVGNSVVTGNWKTLSSATDGSCGAGDISYNTTITNGTKGTCTVVGDNIGYAPNAGQQGSDTCTIQLKDNEGSTVNITVTWNGIDTIAPVLTEVTPVPPFTSDNTPDYTFNTDEAGSITYGGSCSSADTSATINNNFITFTSLNDGTYTDCTIKVTDAVGNVSNTLQVTQFVVDTTTPNVFFTGATPANGADITKNNFKPQVDIITTKYLDTFTYTFDGVPYAYYDSGLVLMYNFDNVAALGESNGIIKDASQYSNNGTGYGGVAWTSSGQWLGAYDFDGNDDYIAIPDYTFAINHTIAAWIDFTNISTVQYIFGGNGQGIGYNGTDFLVYAGTQGTTLPWTKINGFAYVVVTRISAQSYEIYVNGYSLGTVSSNTNNDIIIKYIGKRSDGYAVDGKIDEVRIRKRALSSGEILQMWRSNFAKYDVDKRRFTDDRQCMIDGTYTYTGYAKNLATAFDRDTRNGIVNILGYGSFAPSLNLGSTGVLTATGTLSETYADTFKMIDRKGTTGWYTTIQLPEQMSGNRAGNAIDQSNIKFWAPTTGIDLSSGMHTDAVFVTGTITIPQSFSYHKRYIERKADVVQGYSCPAGIYGNKPSVSVDIPAWQNPDTYSGIINIYINE